MDAHIRYHVHIRATYKQFGRDHLYDPAAAAALKTYRLQLAAIIARFLSELLPGFEVEVRIDLD
jgi:hypothetical protein